MGVIVLIFKQKLYPGGTYMLCERNLDRASLDKLWLLRPPNIVLIIWLCCYDFRYKLPKIWIPLTKIRSRVGSYSLLSTSAQQSKSRFYPNANTSLLMYRTIFSSKFTANPLHSRIKLIILLFWCNIPKLLYTGSN